MVNLKNIVMWGLLVCLAAAGGVQAAVLKSGGTSAPPSSSVPNTVFVQSKVDAAAAAKCVAPHSRFVSAVQVSAGNFKLTCAGDTTHGEPSGMWISGLCCTAPGGAGTGYACTYCSVWIE